MDELSIGVSSSIYRSSRSSRSSDLQHLFRVKTIRKIVSGGQTGVDRGALDAALSLGFPCGGYCPRGRIAEDGTIPDIYPLIELDYGSYPERTLKNVRESDGTAVLYFGILEGGTEQTVLNCREYQKPHAVLDCKDISPSEAASLLTEFVTSHSIHVLNVAGPRHSKVPRAYEYAYDTITSLLQTLAEPPQKT